MLPNNKHRKSLLRRGLAAANSLTKFVFKPAQTPSTFTPGNKEYARTGTVQEQLLTAWAVERKNPMLDSMSHDKSNIKPIYLGKNSGKIPDAEEKSDVFVIFDRVTPRSMDN